MKLPEYISATPAYGRDYRSQAALQADWLEGRDFRLHAPDGSSAYFSIRDTSRLAADGVRVINFRYWRNQRVLPIELDASGIPSAARRASTGSSNSSSARRDSQ